VTIPICTWIDYAARSLRGELFRFFAARGFAAQLRAVAQFTEDCGLFIRSLPRA
jgi:hypothetical protein